MKIMLATEQLLDTVKYITQETISTVYLNPQNSTLKTATQPERLSRSKSGIKMHVKSR